MNLVCEIGIHPIRHSAIKGDLIPCQAQPLPKIAALLRSKASKTVIRPMSCLAFQESILFLWFP